VLIRPARREDSDALFGLLAQLATSYSPERPAFDETIEAVFGPAADDTLLYVVEDDDHVVRGYALCTITRLFYTNGPSAQLHELVVDTESRGRDYGTHLVRAIEQECERRGVRQLTVASRRAGGFYDRLGYSSTAEFLKRTF